MTRNLKLTLLLKVSFLHMIITFTILYIIINLTIVYDLSSNVPSSIAANFFALPSVRISK